jgi:hypothetical protein
MALIELLIEMAFEAVLFSFEFVCRRQSRRRPSWQRAGQVVSERRERRQRERSASEPADRASGGAPLDEGPDGPPAP